MPNILFLGHLNVFDVIPRLHRLAPKTWKGVPERGEVNHPDIGLGASILLRAHKEITKENWLDDLPIAEHPALKGGGDKPYDLPWTSMRRLLTQASELIMTTELAQKVLTGKMGRAMLSRLDPGSTIFWHVDDGPYHRRHARFHLPILTNPGCLMYSGPEVVHMQTGNLHYYNNSVRHSAANWGAEPRVHLIFEMEKVPKDAA